MIEARCSCGALSASCPPSPVMVVACHCTDCQRRTGSPFGVGAFYRAAEVTLAGSPAVYTRPATSGGTVSNYFCPTCGTILFWKAARLKAMVGIAVGSFADPGFTAPARSIFERSRYGWIEFDCTLEHSENGI